MFRVLDILEPFKRFSELPKQDIVAVIQKRDCESSFNKVFIVFSVEEGHQN